MKRLSKISSLAVMALVYDRRRGRLTHRTEHPLRRPLGHPQQLCAYVPGWAGAYLKTGFTGATVKVKQRNTIDLYYSYYSIDGGPDIYLQKVSGTVNLTPMPLPVGSHTLRVSSRVVAGSRLDRLVAAGPSAAATCYEAD